MSQTENKDQFIAIVLAVIAVTLFAVFESVLGGIVKKISIDGYILYRLTFTCALYFLVVWVVSIRSKSCVPLYFAPRHIDGILFVRGFVTVFYWACLAVAFVSAESQALTYPFFFLHPIWQIGFSRLMTKEWPPVRRQVAPIMLILLGVLAFALSNPASFKPGSSWQLQLLDALPFCLPAFFAGIGFAYTNELSSSISRRCNEYPFKLVGEVPVEKIDGLRITAYTTYASLLLLPVLAPLMAVFLDLIGMSSVVISPSALGRLGDHIWAVSLACLIVALGTWAITESFARAKQTAQIAALDGLIVPIAAGLDYWHGDLPIHDPNFVWMAGALVLIVAGAILSAFRT